VNAVRECWRTGAELANIWLPRLADEAPIAGPGSHVRKAGTIGMPSSTWNRDWCGGCGTAGFGAERGPFGSGSGVVRSDVDRLGATAGAVPECGGNDPAADGVLRRFAVFTRLYPWQWTPAEGEAWIANVEHRAMQSVEHTMLDPLSEPAVRRRRRDPERGRQRVPGAAAAQHIQDRCQRGPVVDPWPATTLMPFRVFGNQRLGHALDHPKAVTICHDLRS